MEQSGERDRLFDGLPESPRAEPRPPVKGTFTRTGILPSQALKSLIAGGEIRAAPEITADQIQPASLDLRLGKVAYRIRASFLPGLLAERVGVAHLGGELGRDARGLLVVAPHGGE